MLNQQDNTNTTTSTLPPASQPLTPAQPPTRAPQPSAFDQQVTAKAFAQLLPRLEALPEEALSVGGTDRREAVLAATEVGRRVTQPKVRDVFAKLPEDLFSLAMVDDLRPAALACWHALAELDEASLESNEAKLPVALADEAAVLRARMMKLAEYQLEDHPVAGPKVAALRSGTGYVDLALDLRQLAKLYTTHHDVVSADNKHYRPGDAGDASRLADTIVMELAKGQEQAQQLWSDRARRAFALLVEIHEEVATTGRWLFRAEGGEERFPSIYVLGRNNPRRSAPEAPAAEPTAPAATRSTAPPPAPAAP